MRGKSRRGFAVLLLMLAVMLGGPSAGPAVEMPNPTPVNTGAASDQGSLQPLEGPDLERWYFSRWHEPYGAELEAAHLKRIWADVHAVPAEPAHRAVSSWQIAGPFGMVNSSGGKYTGRVLDLETETSPIRLAGASGGLWTYVIIFIIPVPVAMSDEVNSLAIGSFATHPSDDNTIILGTGEPWVRSGTGLYKTTDGGATWNKLTLPHSETAFYKVRYSPDGNTIHAAGLNYGYYRSTDGGATWSNTLGNSWYKGVTDFAIDPSNPSTIFATVYDYFGTSDGLYKSTNSGATWTKLTSGLPSEPGTTIRRGAVAVSSNGAYVYVAFANDSNGLLGVYKSTNSGASFSNVSPGSNYMGTQGWYDNIITVSPLNASIALVGGVSLYRTTDAGSTWSAVSDGNLHADYHRFRWTSTANYLYACQDGGWAYSTDAGLTWSSASNLQPITQYVNIDVSADGTVMGGGSQDNGLSLSSDSGTNWSHALGGDGGGFAINPGNFAEIWATNGVYNDSWAFHRLHTADSGTNWNFIDNGVNPSGQWYPRIRTDKVPSVYLYHASGTGSTHWVYQSTDRVNWTAINSTAFAQGIAELTVSAYSSGGSTVWACLNDTTSGNRLRVGDTVSGSATWYTTRDSGLPTGVKIRKVAVPSSGRDVAYALMNGLGNSGQKVYKTADRGLNWTNITGNLPDVPMADLVQNPSNSNELFLGTEFGMYHTTDGGATWERWNDGMPDATIVTELVFVDLSGSGGGKWIYAGTYGRAILKRDISGLDAGIFSDDFETANTSAWSNTIP